LSARLLYNQQTLTRNMATEIEHEEDYASEEDSDFAPDDVPAAEESSASEDEAEDGGVERNGDLPASKKRKQRADDAAEDAGFENSGDEAVIDKGKKKRRKKKGDQDDGRAVDEEDEGGEGGLIKTRSMRATEYVSPRAESPKSYYLTDLRLIEKRNVDLQP
jgi:hypothetical protein